LSAWVEVDRLGIQFEFDRQHRPVTPGAARIRRHCTSGWGLRGISLSLAPGESAALIGPNGAGKTTLLRAIAGVLAPDEGSVVVSGRLGPLLSTDGGLTPTLTGRESCRLLGALAGIGRSELRDALDAIAARSGLGDAFDHPVSSYSQGMRARLGFAAMEQSGPELLLLDEVHEAVDHEYREVLEARVTQIVSDGGIVVAVGHDHAGLSRLCRRAILLEEGHVKADGEFDEVVAGYVEEVEARPPAS
jgi:ABC-type polysaccharide/polyol phosphate transport system ATPase subunit